MSLGAVAPETPGAEARGPKINGLASRSQPRQRRNTDSAARVGWACLGPVGIGPKVATA